MALDERGKTPKRPIVLFPYARAMLIKVLDRLFPFWPVPPYVGQDVFLVDIGIAHELCHGLADLPAAASIFSRYCQYRHRNSLPIIPLLCAHALPALLF